MVGKAAQQVKESVMKAQSQPVVVVTGASRGAGKGIAIALGATGATVYVTGRSRREGDAAPCIHVSF